MGLSVLIAYGFGLQLPFVVPALSVVLLCKPGPPIPLVKGAVLGVVITVLLIAGLLMVPVLEHYPVTGIVLTGAVLYVLFFASARKANPLTLFLVIAFTIIPAAGFANQALAIALAQGVGIAIGVGGLATVISNALFSDPPGPAKPAAAPPEVSPEAAGWSALRATLVVMPVFFLALTNPAFYIPAVMKTVALGQQASVTNANAAGRELVGSTLMGALMGVVVWSGLTLWPNLWMLMLWVVATSLWAGVRLFRIKPTPYPPSYWVNALMTMIIVLGPAIEDSQNGKDVYTAGATRVALYVVVALYGWVTVWVLERWRASRSRALFPGRG